MGVAEAAVAAARELHGLIGFGDIPQRDLAVRIADLGAGGHLDREVGRVCAGTVLRATGPAVAGTEVLAVAEVDERVEGGIRAYPDAAAAAAIATVGALGPATLVVQKARAASTAGACAYEDLGLVEKLHPAFRGAGSATEAEPISSPRPRR